MPFPIGEGLSNSGRRPTVECEKNFIPSARLDTHMGRPIWEAISFPMPTHPDCAVWSVRMAYGFIVWIGAGGARASLTHCSVMALGTLNVPVWRMSLEDAPTRTV